MLDRIEYTYVLFIPKILAPSKKLKWSKTPTYCEKKHTGGIITHWSNWIPQRNGIFKSFICCPPPFTPFHTPFYPIMLTLIFPLVWQIKNHQIGFFITSTYADVIMFQSGNDVTFYLNFWYISWHVKCIFLNFFQQTTIWKIRITNNR